MKRVLTAVVLIPLVLLVVFDAPLWLFALLIGGIVSLALHEYLDLAEAAGLKPFKWPTYIAAIAPLLFFVIKEIINRQDSGEQWYAPYPPDYWFLRNLFAVFVLAPLIFGIPLVFRKNLNQGLASSASSSLGILYVAGSLSLLVSLRSNPVQGILIIFVLFSVWAGDIAAYYVGRTLGKHGLAPVVSPNKTWEGAIASVAASVGIAFAVFHFAPVIMGYFMHRAEPALRGDLLFSLPAWWQTLILGILTNVAAQFGDLFESALKRGANLKDSGTLLPGHGGILDRIDALLFAIPVVWYYAQFPTLLRLAAKPAL